MTKKMTTAKIMINIQSAIPSSTFSEITPQAILFPAFPTLSPVDDRSSSPAILKFRKLIQILLIKILLALFRYVFLAYFIYLRVLQEYDPGWMYHPHIMLDGGTYQE